MNKVASRIFEKIKTTRRKWTVRLIYLIEHLGSLSQSSSNACYSKVVLEIMEISRLNIRCQSQIMVVLLPSAPLVHLSGSTLTTDSLFLSCQWLVQGMRVLVYTRIQLLVNPTSLLMPQSKRKTFTLICLSWTFTLSTWSKQLSKKERSSALVRDCRRNSTSKGWCALTVQWNYQCSLNAN